MKMKPEADLQQRFLFDTMGVRGELVRLDSSFKALLENHDYPREIKAQLGEALSAAALLASTIKLDGALIMQVEGDGPMRTLIAQANSDNTVRGLAHYDDSFETAAGFSELVGQGRMVITIDAQGSERYQGIVELKGDSIAETLKTYFTQSEQLPTQLWLTSIDGMAAGLLLQKMPSEHGGEEEWEHLVALAETLTDEELLSLPFETILYRLFHEERVLVFDSEPVAFRCSCSRERIASALLNMGKEEVESLLEEMDVVETHCDFCMAKYNFDAVDVAALFSDAMPAEKGQ
ncbi:Hsp33 family molecular chaperone HslO [Solemya velum gill symbiont]|uniref:Hsp33 family molecular chaperone HslO n=2 Tax=Solemya velum gill symbiont TaxID=2340 RepID=UPI001E2B50D4|nr:Hsp33 family molecular chaperone HslO [Solemya velum gill symbiont]